jgi:cytidyltransferase-like protein
MKVIIVSGYFNPIHRGHIEYFKMAKSHGDALCVIVNSDYQRHLKGSSEFMLEDERLCIVSNLGMVNYALLSIDQDRTVRKTLREIAGMYAPMWGENVSLAFANGGDQTNDVIPEKEECASLGITLIDGLGRKIQSSSWLLHKN